MMRAALCAGVLAPLVLSVGCAGTAETTPLYPRPSPVPAPHPAILLSIDDLQLTWSRGRFASALARELRTSARFAAVHYPVVPESPPSLEVRVTTSGQIHERFAYNLFVPALGNAITLGLGYWMIPLSRDFIVRSEVRVRDGSAELQRYEVSTRTRVYRHQLQSGIDQTEPDRFVLQQSAQNHGRAILAWIAELPSFR